MARRGVRWPAQVGAALLCRGVCSMQPNQGCISWTPLRTDGQARLPSQAHQASQSAPIRSTKHEPIRDYSGATNTPTEKRARSNSRLAAQKAPARTPATSCTALLPLARSLRWAWGDQRVWATSGWGRAGRDKWRFVGSSEWGAQPQIGSPPRQAGWRQATTPHPPPTHTLA